MQLPESVKSYLSKHSSNRWELDWNKTKGIENIVVIPAISEYENILKLLNSMSTNEKYYFNKTLILFVINNLTSSEEEIKADNRKSLMFLRELMQKNHNKKIGQNITETGILVGVVDVASERNELDDKTGGVGFARKIGMDLALTAFDYSIPKKKIIISLDADCTVDNHYLSAITEAFNVFNLNAATIEFTHNMNSQSDGKVILSYEIFLRCYVVGLLYAQSPYAYHTIGSVLACDHKAYIKIGGMNTRKAAEDFYFLQKLAKVYRIGKINDTIVCPSARESWRVPFGTGKCVMKFQSGEKQFLLYDPQVFKILKEWISEFHSDVSLNPEMLLQKAKSIHPELYNFLVIKNFSSQWEKILNNCNSERQLNYQRKNWFDAFNTLKLIHYLRDMAFPMREMISSVKEMFNLLDYNVDPNIYSKNDISILKEYIAILREIENSLLKKIAIG